MKMATPELGMSEDDGIEEWYDRGWSVSFAIYWTGRCVSYHYLFVFEFLI